MSDPIESEKPQEAVASDPLFSVAVWPRVPLRHGGHDKIDHPWHVAINRHSRAETKAGKPWPRWMYAAKTAAQETPRLALLFQKERTGGLPKTFRRCSCCGDGKHVVDNHLTCCLGVKCRECPHLAALDKAEMPEEERDWIKAWTCAGHILAEGGDPAGEGFILTVDDRMYWDSLHESLAMAYGQDHEEESEEESSLNVRGISAQSGGAASRGD